jgi:cell division protein FtsX
VVKTTKDIAPSLEQFLDLLTRVRDLTVQLEAVRLEVKKSDLTDDEKIKTLSDAVKEVELANKHIKEYLDKTFKWVTSFAVFALMALIALFGVIASFIIKNM